MALFSRKDATLPMLTQFYQLEFKPDALLGSEVDRWAGSMLHPGEFAPFNAPPWSLTGDGRRHSDPESEIRALADAYPAIRSMMESLADNTEPSTEVIQGINDLLSQIPPIKIKAAHLAPPSLPDEFRESLLRNYSGFVGEEVIPALLLESAREGESMPKETLYSVLSEFASIVRPFLNRIQTKTERLPFYRCAECGSVFVEEKRARRFCSWRCNHRVNQRGKHKKPHEGT